MAKILTMIMLWPVCGYITLIAAGYKGIAKVMKLDPKRGIAYFTAEIKPYIEYECADEDVGIIGLIIALCIWPYGITVVENMFNELYSIFKQEYDSGIRQRLS